MRSHGLTFVVHCALPCLMMCACSISTATDGAAVRADVTITVNPSNSHPISPYIYGINNASKLDGLPTALTLDRSGGNRWTAYNWETNASNAGSDYNYQNDNSMGSD